MNISIRSDADRLILRLQGALDSKGATALRPVLEDLAMDTNRDVVLDLSAVGALDGSGLGAIAYLHRRLGGGRLQAVGASGQPLALLRRLGLARALGLPAERDSFLATLFRPFVGLTQPEVAH